MQCYKSYIDHSPLKREVWTFWLRHDLSRLGLILDGYQLQTRETIRKRKWKVESVYDRLCANRLDLSKKLVVDDVSIPSCVETDIKRQICNIVNSLEIEKKK